MRRARLRPGHDKAVEAASPNLSYVHIGRADVLTAALAAGDAVDRKKPDPNLEVRRGFVHQRQELLLRRLQGAVRHVVDEPDSQLGAGITRGCCRWSRTRTPVGDEQLVGRRTFINQDGHWALRSNIQLRIAESRLRRWVVARQACVARTPC